MYSPVFLSWPTTSGSPPVISISFSDHSFSVFASSFACTFAHSRPLWRFIFFFKRGFVAFRSFLRFFCEDFFFFFFFLFFLGRARIFTCDFPHEEGVTTPLKQRFPSFFFSPF